VALLLDYMSFLDGAYQSRITEAFHEGAKKFNVDLLIVFGRALEEPNPFSKPHNGIFDLIEARSAQGVVAVSSVLAAHCGAEGMSRFLRERYAALPQVSVGVALPGVPSVVVDNVAAMQAVVEHVVGHHRRRRVAFLAGTPDNPESEDRLLGYRRALEQNGLTFDPALVGYGNFMHWPARSTLATMLDAQGPFDAVVAANDTMALGAVAVLRERGLAVPNDVLVTGFDDVWMGRLGDAALTTVSQPFERMAEQALGLVLVRMAGASVEDVVRVPADMVIRRSCGCSWDLPRAVGEAAETATRSKGEYFRKSERRVAALIEAQLGIARGGGSDDPQRLLGALRVELLGRPGAFMATLEEMLGERRGDHDRHQALHNVIDALRDEFRHVADGELEDLWYRALSRIAFSTTTAGVEHRIDLDNKYMRLLSTADRVSVALDVPTLGDAIAVSLQNVGIDTAFISLFADDQTSELTPLVSLLDGVRVDVPGRSFGASELVQPGSYQLTRRCSLAVFPLVFEMRWLGVAAFEFTAGVNGYHMLRDQFAAALGHVALHRQILNKTMLHERSVQERQATTRRLEALSVLAGGVAHDLNNTLGPLIALPDIILEELDQLDLAQRQRDVLERVSVDLESIKSGALRAAQTIKDLLTLGRQGHAAKDSVELNRILSVELRDSLRLLNETHPGVTITLEPYREKLHVRGSEAHLTRAIMNLVRNAVEAIVGRGEVAVKAGVVLLGEPLSGYETIAAGEYATVSVSDTGGGIPEGEIGRVFEPFFSGKRLGEQSGSGLGLAIVHGVAKEHDGFVDLTSTERGTTFTLYFPRTPAASRVPSAPPAAARGSARILVIDDDPIQGRMARRVLVHLGYEVEVLESGARALELLKRVADSNAGGFELLLLDVQLNETLDGWEILRQVRRSLPGQRAVLTSGQGEDRSAERETGVSWLAKPYTTESLGRAVQAALAAPERSSGIRGQRPALVR
jgi:DNA-binding LacI/PurR family transcriptional regulator/signal transduction histidine kinase/ActR/RegA family two-component response regulator